MSRWMVAILVMMVGSLVAEAQIPPPAPAPKPNQPDLQRRPTAKPSAPGKEEIPPEEDKALSTEEFSFNPLEAEKWLKVGNYYFKLHKYRPAADRYRGATKWNEGYGEAWLRLAETEEKLKDTQAAKEAYNKYLEVAPDAKNAEEIRKKVAKLK